MRSLAKKWGYWWVFLGCTPLAALVGAVGGIIGANVALIVLLEMPLLLLQLLALFVIIRYRKDVFM